MINSFVILLVKAGSFYKLIEIGVLSGIKFLFAPFLSFQLGYNFLQTIIVTTIGGLAGVLFFYYISEVLIALFKKIWPGIKVYFVKQKIHPVNEIKKSKKSFSKKNKFIVMTRRKYGLWGIAALTPVLLSIPLGTFLANKYYRNKKNVLFSLCISVLCWSIVMSSFYFIF
ncbi:MAG TPA: hypothetical protein PKK00_11875 [Bacteroidales bacterium]|nr:hypothetical protein [Bacteroidales bacterium]HPS17979.1 hypothetical protein [Bacteroidales bacterium]